MADLVLVVEIEQSVNTRSFVSAPTDSGVTNSLRRPRHHRAHARRLLAQAANELEAFVGGNAAADDEQDALCFT